jgi:hypothetical protein
MKVADLINQIEALPANWHGVGSVGGNVLQAIARHAERLGAVKNSAETGSGKTTLLFSHLSANHLVFAIDEGKSISQVRSSPLFKAQNVTFIEGLTQETLPAYHFQHKLQLALIDGPHGYPFPDLEYFYFYPQIEPGGMLLVDDIKIPTIRRMFEIIQADDMFRLLEVVGDDMAFFQRTDVPCVSLSSDSWWRQGYNRPFYNEILNPSPATGLLKAYQLFGRLLPKRVKALIPRNIKQGMWKALRR